MLKQLSNGTVAKVVQPATQAEIESPNSGTHYYISLPYYQHNVYKCAGLVHSNEASRAFYLAYWADGKHEQPLQARKVVIMQGAKGQIPDRIQCVDGVWVEHSLGL